MLEARIGLSKDYLVSLKRKGSPVCDMKVVCRKVADAIADLTNLVDCLRLDTFDL